MPTKKIILISTFYLKMSVTKYMILQNLLLNLNFYNRVKVIMYKINLKQKLNDLKVKSSVNNFYLRKLTVSFDPCLVPHQVYYVFLYYSCELRELFLCNKSFNTEGFVSEINNFEDSSGTRTIANG